MCEGAADEDLSVGRHGHGVNGVVNSPSGVETAIHRAIGIKPREVGRADRIDARERARDQDFAIGLLGH